LNQHEQYLIEIHFALLRRRQDRERDELSAMLKRVQAALLACECLGFKRNKHHHYWQKHRFLWPNKK
jgi:hypothetical protein